MTASFVSNPNDFGKLCASCKERKAWAEFPKNRAKTDGHDIRCKPCTQAKNKSQYEKHAEKRREYASAYGGEHKEEKSEYNRQYREAHRDEMIAYLRAYRKTHEVVRSEESKEQMKARKRARYESDEPHRHATKERSRLYRIDNPEKTKTSTALWVSNNQEHLKAYRKNYYASLPIEKRRAQDAKARIKHRDKRILQRAGYIAKKYGSDGDVPNEFYTFLHHWQDTRCFHCNIKITKEDRHLDHIVPLSKRGEHRPYNVYLTCSKCNTSKSDRLLHIEWSPKFVELDGSPVSVFATKQVCKEFPGYDISILSSFHARLGGVKHWPKIALFDHEWLDHKDAAINVIKAKLGLSEQIGARKLSIEIPSTEEAQEFMNKWHLQGFAAAPWYIGLKGAQGWQAIAAFKEHEIGYDLSRMAFKDHVPGGLSRLVQYFLRNVAEKRPIVSYCDLRFGEGGGYLATGFAATGDTAPAYMYANGTGLFHRRSYSLKRMAVDLDYFDGEKTERENAAINGLIRITMKPLRRFIFTP